MYNVQINRRHCYGVIFTLQKLSNYRDFLAVKIENFTRKNFDIFLIFAQNIDCGVHVRIASCILRKIGIPLHTAFCYMKVGHRGWGYILHGHVFLVILLMFLLHSAGIGRSGSFIALDYLVDQASVDGYVNVFQCVQNLRHQRVNMVQTLVCFHILSNVSGIQETGHTTTRSITRIRTLRSSRPSHLFQKIWK